MSKLKPDQHYAGRHLAYLLSCQLSVGAVQQGGMYRRFFRSSRLPAYLAPRGLAGSLCWKSCHMHGAFQIFYVVEACCIKALLPGMPYMARPWHTAAVSTLLGAAVLETVGRSFSVCYRYVVVVLPSHPPHN